MRYFLLLAVTGICFSSIAQTTFKKLTSDLLLKIPTYETDSVTRRFLARYVPYLADPEPSSWSAYPPIADSAPPVNTVHSLILDRHPFFDFKVTECRLDLFTREKNNKVVGLRNYYVTVLFGSKREAEQAFVSICRKYKALNTTKKIVTRSSKKIALFNTKDPRSYPDRAGFILTEDDLFENRWKIIIAGVFGESFDEYYKLGD